MPWQREVYFIGGFDPRGPARDHRLYAEAVAQHPTTAAGETVRLGPRQRCSPLLDRWDVSWQQADGQRIDTRHHVMRWDDIVRRRWPRLWRQAWRDRVDVYARARRHGVFGPTWRHARPTFWLAMLPLLIGAGLGLLWAGLAALLVVLTAVPAWLAAGLALAAWLWSWRRTEVALDADWLLRLFAFTWQLGRGELPELEQRLDQLADTLVQAAEHGGARELLVVGHSTGSQLAAAVLARAIRRAPWLGSRGPAIALLTLGHCTPALAWVRPAQWFRDDLALLAHHAPLTWHDLSAPADWAALARVPPWLQPGTARLDQRSPRFHATLGRADYQALLAQRHALHLQYLRAPRHAGGYDPVVWMAGPLTLAERHAALHAARPKR